MHKSIYKITNFLILAVACSAAHADPYRYWADEIAKASKGAQICADSYAEVVRWSSGSKERKKYAEEAARTCGTMKGVFNVTMLTARSSVSGMDDELRDFHRSVLDSFDKLVPEASDSPLDYMAKAASIQRSIAKMQYDLIRASAGMP